MDELDTDPGLTGGPGLGIDRRRLGSALLAFGLVGLVLAGIMALGLIAGAVAARNLDDRFTATQDQLVLTLDRTSTLVGQLAVTTTNAGETVLTTSQTVISAAAVLGRLADISDELAGSLDISILGQRPLAGAAVKFGELAGDVRAVQSDTTRLGASLGTNALDVTALGAEVDGLATQLVTLRLRVEAFDRTADVVSLLVGAILLLGLLAAWLAVGAAGCAWLGWRLRRPAIARVEGEGPAVP